MDNSLEHYGIIGMKWGIRRTPEQLGHGRKTRKKSDDAHEDYKKTHDSSNIRKLSDAELRRRLNRLNMEKQYSQLNPSSIERGRKILISALKAPATAVAITTTAITLKNNYATITSWLKKN